MNYRPNSLTRVSLYKGLIQLNKLYIAEKVQDISNKAGLGDDFNHNRSRKVQLGHSIMKVNLKKAISRE